MKKQMADKKTAESRKFVGTEEVDLLWRGCNLNNTASESGTALVDLDSVYLCSVKSTIKFFVLTSQKPVFMRPNLSCVF